MKGKSKQKTKMRKELKKYNDKEIQLLVDKEIYESDECSSYKNINERLAFYNGARFVLRHIESQ